VRHQLHHPWPSLFLYPSSLLSLLAITGLKITEHQGKQACLVNAQPLVLLECAHKDGHQSKLQDARKAGGIWSTLQPRHQQGKCEGMTCSFWSSAVLKHLKIQVMEAFLGECKSLFDGDVIKGALLLSAAPWACFGTAQCRMPSSYGNLRKLPCTSHSFVLFNMLLDGFSNDHENFP